MGTSGAVGATFSSPVSGAGNSIVFNEPYTINNWVRDIDAGFFTGLIFGTGQALFTKSTFSVPKTDIAPLEAVGAEMPTPPSSFGTEGKMGFQPLTDLPEITITSPRQVVTPTSASLSPMGIGSTGRTIPNNLAEQMAMKEIMNNPHQGDIITNMKPINDPRWRGWLKMQYIKELGDGTKINIHYVGDWDNGTLKAVDDFKFK